MKKQDIQDITEYMDDYNDETKETSLQPLEKAVKELRKYGVEISYEVAYRYPALVAEAVNYAAKVLSYEFYNLKAELVREAAECADEWGWNGEIYYIYDRAVGEVSFHDPYCEIYYLVVDTPLHKGYPYEWSEVPRQHLAFIALKDKVVRKCLALATDPKVVRARKEMILFFLDRYIQKMYPEEEDGGEFLFLGGE